MVSVLIYVAVSMCVVALLEHMSTYCVHVYRLQKSEEGIGSLWNLSYR
jgi:hypothetical protein